MNRTHSLTAALMALAACSQASAATIAVVKDPNCGCCSEWVARLRSAGFAVTVTDTAEQPAVSRCLGVPDDLRGCHSATVDGYVIEGHVPPQDIARLLAERPDGRGLAVPGMPVGSPGMEQGGTRQPYVTVLFSDAGRSVFARH